MRVILIIIALIVSYQLLAGWPQVLADLEPWLRAGLALIVITLALPVADASRPDSKRRILKSLRRSSWMDYLSIAFIILCIQILLLSAFTLLPKPATELAETTHELVGIGEGSSNSGDDSSKAPPNKLNHGRNGKWLWNDHYGRSLPKQPDHRPGNTPEISLTVFDESSVEQLKASSIYIKSFALDYFDGTQWSIYQPTKFIINNSRTSNIDLDTNPVPELPIYFYRITQSYQRNGQNVFCSLQHPLRTNIKTLTKVNTDTYLLPRLSGDSRTYDYDSTSQPRILSEILKLNPNSKISIGETDSVYLSQIPDSKLQAQISRFASRVPADLLLDKKLAAIRDLIQSQCRYSLQISNPHNLNSLENFLFHERRGYCEFFASATASLCRHHGIPSRIAFGWTGGKHHTGTKLFSFLSRNAHAWTEIYLEDYGWVIFDTTPSSAVPNIPLADNEEPPELESTSYDEDYDFGVPYFEMTFGKAGIALGSGLLVTVLLLVSRLKTSHSPSSSASLHIQRNPPAYLTQFASLCAMLGLPYRPSTTLQQNVNLLKNHPALSQLDLTEDDLDQLLSYHYDITYRNHPSDKATEAKLTTLIKNALKSHSQN